MHIMMIINYALKIESIYKQYVNYALTLEFMQSIQQCLLISTLFGWALFRPQSRRRDWSNLNLARFRAPCELCEVALSPILLTLDQ